MTSRTRDILVFVVCAAIVLGAALGGYLVVRARAGGAEPLQSRAAVTFPTPQASGVPPEPDYPRWTVGKAVGPVVVRVAPSQSAAVKARLGVVNDNGYPTLVLVGRVREVAGKAWYRVSVAMRPNGAAGWVRRGSSPSTRPRPRSSSTSLSERSRCTGGAS